MKLKKIALPSKESIDFFTKITKIKEENNCSYIQAILDYCADNALEIETVSKLINDTLKAEIEKEALKLNLLKGNNSNVVTKSLFE